MKYERDFAFANYIIDLIYDIDKYHSDWRLINMFYNEHESCYVAILEREVE